MPADTLTSDTLPAPLPGYGGSSWNHTLAAGIDHGNNVGNGHGALADDQRGSDYACAIGAFEFGAGPDRISFNST